MATLADSFLADLDDLDDEEQPLEEEGGEGEADLDDEMADVEALNYDDLDAVAKLQHSHKFKDILQKVEEALKRIHREKEKEGSSHKSGENENESAQETQNGENGKEAEGKETNSRDSLQQDGSVSVSLDDSEYDLIVDCNSMMVDVDNEIAIVHNYIRDKYRLKFPELESLVLHPIDYARVVKRIGNEMDLTLVDLEGLLPSATIMVVSVTASTTTGKPLSEENLERVMDACDRALGLDDAKRKMLEFVESRMGSIAPNLSAIVGSAIAAQLMGTAGGLMALASTPSCNVLNLGSKRKGTLAGYSSATAVNHAGYVFNTEIVQGTPPALRVKASRLVAGKCTLAARMDAIKGDPTGEMGRKLREEMQRKIEKWQEPPPAKQPKPLPVPDAEQKKKRGGRRLRKMKERYAVTDMRKLQNRMAFGVAEESSLGDGIGEGYGMLGQAGSGKLRMSAAQSKFSQKVAKKFKEKNYGSSGNTSGLSSSLAFTPVQGFELTNPQANLPQLGSGTQSTYFSETGSFSKIKKA